MVSKNVFSLLILTHSIRRSFRGIRNSYVCKELFDTFRTIRDVFERDLVNGQTCLFDNSYRATNSNIVKTLAIHYSFSLSTIDFHSSFFFRSTRGRCAGHYICQKVSRVSVEKRLTGVVCTSSDLRIVPIFWDAKKLLCETMNLLRETMNLLWETMNLLWETMNLLWEKMNLLWETTHTDETSCNVAYDKIFDRNDSVDKSFDREEIKPTHFVRSNVVAKCTLVRVFLKAVPGSVKHNSAIDSVTKVPIISDKELKGMKNDLQFRSRTPFRRLAVKPYRSRDREPSRISLRKVIQSLKFRKLR